MINFNHSKCLSTPFVSFYSNSQKLNRTFYIFLLCINSSSWELVHRLLCFDCIMDVRRCFSYVVKSCWLKLRGVHSMVAINYSYSWVLSSKSAEPVRREKRMWPRLQMSACWSQEPFSCNYSGAIYGRLPQKCFQLLSICAQQAKPKSASLRFLI